MTLRAALAAGSLALGAVACDTSQPFCKNSPPLGEMPVLVRRGEVDEREWLYGYCAGSSAERRLAFTAYGVDRLRYVSEMVVDPSAEAVVKALHTDNVWTLSRADLLGIETQCDAMEADSGEEGAR